MRLLLQGLELLPNFQDVPKIIRPEIGHCWNTSSTQVSYADRLIRICVQMFLKYITSYHPRK